MVLRALRSAGLASTDLARWRLRLEAFLVRMWLLFAWACRNFFLAVTLNLFWAPLWVFSFGIFSSGFGGHQQRRHGPVLPPRRAVLGGHVLDIEHDPVEDLMAE